jgi:hypothetical protein
MKVVARHCAEDVGRRHENRNTARLKNRLESRAGSRRDEHRFNVEPAVRDQSLYDQPAFRDEQAGGNERRVIADVAVRRDSAVGWIVDSA